MLPAADAAGAADAAPRARPAGFWATPGQCGECPVQSLARIRRSSATAGDDAILLEYGSAVSFYPYP